MNKKIMLSITLLTTSHLFYGSESSSQQNVTEKDLMELHATTTREIKEMKFSLTAQEILLKARKAQRAYEKAHGEFICAVVQLHQDHQVLEHERQAFYGYEPESTTQKEVHAILAIADAVAAVKLSEQE